MGDRFPRLNAPRFPSFLAGGADDFFRGGAFEVPTLAGTGEPSGMGVVPGGVSTGMYPLAI